MGKERKIKDSTIEKYKLLIDEWFVNGFNGTKAYKKFYPECTDETAAVNFSEILRITKVQEYLQSKHDNKQESAELTHKELVDNLKEIRDRCMQAEPVLDKMGQPTGEYRFDSQAAIKAVDLLGKHIGLYEKDNDQKGDQVIVIG